MEFAPDPNDSTSAVNVAASPRADLRRMSTNGSGQVDGSPTKNVIESPLAEKCESLSPESDPFFQREQAAES